jgi:cysteinyl-tRNA synthetase
MLHSQLRLDCACNQQEADALRERLLVLGVTVRDARQQKVAWFGRR